MSPDPEFYYPVPCPHVPCSGPFSAVDFFKDSPWLDVPFQRRGQIVIEPLYPRLGLLGGSSSTRGGKLSKLAALAAARKRKEQDNSSEGGTNQQSSSVALLDKLQESKKFEASSDLTSDSVIQLSSENNSVIVKDQHARQTRSYPVRQRKSPDPRPELPRATSEQANVEAQQAQDSSVLQAGPSEFAKAMLGDPERDQLHKKRPSAFQLPYITDPNFAKSSAFTGPSPDDIVINAQSKGAVNGGKVPARHH